MANKPQGWSGVVHLDGGGLARVILPSSKDEREIAVAEMFQRGFSSDELPLPKILSIKQNREADFDFEIQTADGKRDLELVEFAPIEQARGYDASSEMLNVGQTADRLVDLIRKKAEHYAGYGGTGLFLLIYSTHYAFQPIEDVFFLVRESLCAAAPLFAGVYFTIPSNERAVETWVLSSTPAKEFTASQILTMRKRWFSNSDFRKDYLGSSV